MALAKKADAAYEKTLIKAEKKAKEQRRKARARMSKFVRDSRRKVAKVGENIKDMKTPKLKNKSSRRATKWKRDLAKFLIEQGLPDTPGANIRTPSSKQANSDSDESDEEMGRSKGRWVSKGQEMSTPKVTPQQRKQASAFVYKDDDLLDEVEAKQYALSASFDVFADPNTGTQLRRAMIEAMNSLEARGIKMNPKDSDTRNMPNGPIIGERGSQNRGNHQKRHMYKPRPRKMENEIHSGMEEFKSNDPDDEGYGDVTNYDERDEELDDDEDDEEQGFDRTVDEDHVNSEGRIFHTLTTHRF